MALPASDTFSGTTGQDLPVYSANWASAGSSSGDILECDGAGAARTLNTNDSACKWTGDTFAANHYAEVVIDPSSGTSLVGAVVRAASAGNYYGAQSSESNIEIFEMTGGTWTQLGSSVGVSWSSGTHTVRLAAAGSTLTTTYDGVETTRTDSSHTTGSAGVCGWGNTAPGLSKINQWDADNIPVVPEVEYVNSALGGTATTTSFSITLPATAANDILVLEYVHRGTGDGTIGGTYSGPAFAEKHDQQFATGTFSGKTLWSRATGNHTGQTVTGSGLTNSCAAVVTIYRAALSSGDPLADATIVGEDNASGDETQAQITTATNGAMVVLVVVNSPDLAVTSPACTSPGALTIRAERLSTGGTDSSIMHASGVKATAGATGAFTWAQTNAASGSWAYAIKPEPAGTTLAPADTAHGHTTDAVVITQTHVLGGVADTAHGHTTDAVTISQTHQLAGLADTAHAHTTDAVVIAIQVTLAPADTAHAHTTDALTISQTHRLTVADTAHGHTADAVVISQTHRLTVADTAHGHTTDAVTISQTHRLAVADTAHGHTTESVVVSLEATLAPNDTAHAHTTDAVTISQTHVLVVADTAHGHTTENVTIGSTGTLAPADTAHAHTTDAVTISQTHRLTVADSSHGHTTENVTIGAAGTNVLTGLADTAHAHTTDAVTISQTHRLTVADSSHGHTADTVTLTQTHVLIVAGSEHGHTSDTVTLTQVHVLAVADTEHRHTVDTVVFEGLPGRVTSVVAAPGASSTVTAAAATSTVTLSADARSLVEA